MKMKDEIHTASTSMLKFKKEKRKQCIVGITSSTSHILSFSLFIYLNIFFETDLTKGIHVYGMVSNWNG